MTKRMKLSKLVEDYDIYPRNRIDEHHVLDLVRALQAGVELPPIVVEASSGRIVDGFHRARAWRRHLGEDGTVTVDARSYDSEAVLFADAARLNAGHGRKLERQDQVRVVVRARELGIGDAEIAAVLAIPADRVSVLAVRVATTPEGVTVPVKHGAEHLQGRTLTHEQVQAMRNMRGASARRLARELRQLVENGVADLPDPKVREELVRLVDAVRTALKGAEAEPAAAAV